MEHVQQNYCAYSGNISFFHYLVFSEQIILTLVVVLGGTFHKTDERELFGIVPQKSCVLPNILKMIKLNCSLAMSRSIY